MEYREAPPPGSRPCLNRLDTPQKWVKKCGSHLESHGSSHIIWWLTMRNRIVFNCSFTHQANNCNELILPGPNLSSSLLGILLWFREHSTAVSSDIKGMFHQARLLPRTDHSYVFCRVICRETTLLVYTNGKSSHLGQLAVQHMHFRGTSLITVKKEMMCGMLLKDTFMWTIGSRASLPLTQLKQQSTRWEIYWLVEALN